MTGPHHGMAADAAVAAAAAEVGGPILAGVEVRTDDFRRSQRTVMAIRGLVFGTGFAIAFVGGLGWVLLSVGAVAHYFLFRARQVLVTTGVMLAVLTSGRRTATTERSWPGGVDAELWLDPGQPDVEIRISDWLGRISGLDLSAAETTIRTAGGEPLRVVQRDDP